VVSSKNCLIKKDLVYNNKYKLNKKEYSNFIKNFKNSKNIISSNNNNSINNSIKENNNPIKLPLNNNNRVIKLKNKSNNKESINNSSNSEIKRETIEVQHPLNNIIINNNNNNSSIPESELTIDQRIAQKRALLSIKNNNNSIYSIASKAYFTLKNEDKKENNSKAILDNINSNSLYKPKSYKKAINSPQKEL